MARRTTLAPLEGNALPVAAGRASMAGGRMSIAGKPPQRLSLAPGRRQSVAPAAMSGATMTGRPSLAPPRLGRDPRDVRSRGFKEDAAARVLGFCVARGIKTPLTHRTLLQPTQREFQDIFVFVVRHLDPTYAPAPSPKFEDEVPGLVRALGYPFASDISRSHLSSVGSEYSWISVLAMLVWLVQLVEACEVNVAEQQQAAQGGEAMFFGYLSQAYAQWLDGNDAFELLAADLAKNFDRKNTVLAAEIDALKKRNGELHAKLHKLDKEQPPLARVEEHKAKLESESAKIAELNALVAGKIAKRQQAGAAAKQQLQQVSARVGEVEGTRKRLQATVASQPISAAEAQALQRQHAELAERLRATVADKAQAEGAKCDREITLAKRLRTTEDALRRFKASCRRLRADFDELQALSAPEAASRQLRGVVEPAMAHKLTALGVELTGLETAFFALQERLMEAEAALASTQTDARELERLLGRREADCAAEEQALAAERAALSAEEERLEAAVRAARAANDKAELRGLQARQQDLMLQYQTMVQEAADEKARFNSTMLAALDLLVQHKSGVEAQLTALRAELNEAASS